MPTPTWSYSYNISQTPEANGFTRINQSLPAPTVLLQMTGTTANRRIQVTSIAGEGDLLFLINDVPSFDAGRGMTAEGLINVSGPGDVGFEARFIHFAASVSIFTDKVRLERPWSQETPSYVEALTPSNNADILWRTTFDGSNVRIYRAGALVLTVPSGQIAGLPLPSFMFWFEGGGVGIIKSMNFYIGGAVAP